MIHTTSIVLLFLLVAAKDCTAFFTTQGTPYCGSKNSPINLYGTSGRITSPNYPFNYPSGSSCAWRINAPFGSRVQLQFYELCTEGCCDVVVAFDGYSTSYQQLFSESGCRTPSRSWLSSGQYVTVVFSSDGSVTERGFALRWSVEGLTTAVVGELTTSAPVSVPAPYCGSRSSPIEIRGYSGKIVSPNYPWNYPNNADCTWRIQSYYRRRLVVRFLSFCTESGYDFLHIFDGPSESSRRILSWSGCSIPPGGSQWSSGEYLLITFRSDSSATRSGFEIDWFDEQNFVTAEPTNAPVMTTASPEYCGSPSSPINYYNSSGQVRSPNYPGFYPRNASCGWRINAPFGQAVRMQFQYLCTEYCCDKVRIYDGGYTFNPLLGEYSGCYYDYNVTVTSRNRALVTFTSDYSVQNYGFVLQWDHVELATAVPFTTTDPGPRTTDSSEYCGSPNSPINYYSSSGQVRSPNYPGFYPNYANCGWRINAPFGQVVRLQIQYLCTEECCDKVRIYDGGYTFNPLLGEYSGCFHYYNVTVTSRNRALVTFTSDWTQRNYGFVLQWNFVQPITETQPPQTTPSTEYCGTPDNPIEYNFYPPSYTGVISSPNFPYPYPNYMNCAWRIRAYSGYSVYTNVTYLCTESCCDFLSMHDGSSRFSPQIFRSSGCFGSTYYVRSNYDYLYIAFSSDSSITNAGFNLTWGFSWGYNQGTGGHSTEPPAPMTTPSRFYCGSPWSPIYISSPLGRGTIYSPNYPGDYHNNANCGWRIYVPPEQVVTVTFSDICTETCCDHVRFYDGAYPTDTLITSVSSCNPYTDPISSTGNYMLITFTSDGSVTNRGFQLDWSAGIACPPNFVNLDGTCYYFLLTPLDWFQAEKYCTTFRPRNYDVHLAGFETPDEWNTVRDYIRERQTLRSRGFWTSGSQIDNPRGWTWSATGVSIYYNAWAPGGPSGNGNCVQLWADREHRFDDVNCENSDISAVCEYQRHFNSTSAEQK